MSTRRSLPLLLLALSGCNLLDAVTHAGAPLGFLAVADPATGKATSLVKIATWTQSVDMQGTMGAAFDSTGAAIVVGHFDATPTIGGMTVSGSSTTPSGFVAKLDGSGNAAWVRTVIGGATNNYGTGAFVERAVVDSDDSIFVAGGFFASATFHDGTTLQGVGSIGTDGAPGADLFVAHYDASGKLLWAARPVTSAMEVPAVERQKVFVPIHLLAGKQHDVFAFVPHNTYAVDAFVHVAADGSIAAISHDGVGMPMAWAPDGSFYGRGACLCPSTMMCATGGAFSHYAADGTVLWCNPDFVLAGVDATGAVLGYSGTETLHPTLVGLDGSGHAMWSQPPDNFPPGDVAVLPGGGFVVGGGPSGFGAVRVDGQGNDVWKEPLSMQSSASNQPATLVTVAVDAAGHPVYLGTDNAASSGQTYTLDGHSL